MERRIKKWSRKKKEALIEGNWKKISVLAKKKFKIKPSIHYSSSSTQAEREQKINHRSSNISTSLEKGPSTNSE